MEMQAKVQVVLAVALVLELLALYMILVRTVANLEYAFNRVEAIIGREVQLALRAKEQEKLTREKAHQSDIAKSKKNELLLNIPFMERLNKEKKKEDNG